MELIIIMVITCLFIILMIFIGQKLLISSILRPQKPDNFQNPQQQEFLFQGEQKFTVQSPREHKISCTYIPLSEGEPPEKIVIFLHELNGNKENMRKYLPLFRKLGFSAVLVDSRFCGESGGSELGLSVVEAEDLKPVFKWIFDCFGENIKTGLFGESFGASAALIYASQNEVSFVISNSAFSDLHALLKERLRADYKIGPFPMLIITEAIIKYKYKIDIKSASPLNLMKKGIFNSPVPIFFIHGENDTYILPQMSIDLYNAKNNGYKKFWLIPEGGHLNNFDKNQNEYEKKIEEFFNKVEK